MTVYDDDVHVVRLIEKEDIGLVVPRVWVPSSAVGRDILDINVTRPYAGISITRTWRYAWKLPSSMSRPRVDEQPGPSDNYLSVLVRVPVVHLHTSVDPHHDLV